MIMKALKLALISSSILWLSACLGTTHGEFFGDQIEYLKDDVGVVTECTTETDWTTGKRAFKGVAKTDAKEFWRKNNLPKGTLYFTCEGDKEVLPKDCQGNSLTTPQIRRYWKKYNLPVGTDKFNCSNGVPKVLA